MLGAVFLETTTWVVERFKEFVGMASEVWRPKLGQAPLDVSLLFVRDWTCPDSFIMFIHVLLSCFQFRVTYGRINITLAGCRLALTITKEPTAATRGWIQTSPGRSIHKQIPVGHWVSSGFGGSSFADSLWLRLSAESRDRVGREEHSAPYMQWAHWLVPANEHCSKPMAVEN